MREDNDLADKIAANGQALVETKYSFAKIGRQIVESLKAPLRSFHIPGLRQRILGFWNLIRDSHQSIAQENICFQKIVMCQLVRD